MDQLARIDKALDEALVNLGARTQPSRERRKSDARWRTPSINSRCAPIVQVTPACSGCESSSRRRSGPNYGWCRARPSGGRGQRRLLHPVHDRRPMLFEHALAHEQPKMIARHQHVMKGFRRRSG